jgi:hypothetical protein
VRAFQLAAKGAEQVSRAEGKGGSAG